ncbi:MAG: glycoside hydrolase family 31 protein [Kiritimatiellae bacterium]|nr:glycoside hydrolase family 31 protein [Kiritimatiellia bacterium]
MTVRTCAAALCILLGCGGSLFAAPGKFSVKLLPGEGWWGAATTLGRKAPFGLAAKDVEFDVRHSNLSNQAAPVMLSNKGRWIWSEQPFKCTLKDGVMTFEGDAEFALHEAKGGTLRAAYLEAAKNHFPPSGKTPDLALIAHPQWNTWVELTYNQNQKDILAYAKAIKANGFPEGGVIMIDDTWQYGYGIWQFDPRKFPDPKAMMAELHKLGYKVMVWVVPFVSMDSPGYREMAFGLLDAGVKCEKGGLILASKHLAFDYAQDAKVFDWWNGKSAHVDFTNPLGAKWFARELKRLVDDYGVDGFKLDAGDMGDFAPYITHKPASPADLCEAYAKIGLQFPLNEYRACWKMGGQPLVQRLCDKGHDWEAIAQLMPDMIEAGLLGHPFVCPDMIGSGSWMAFAPDAPHPYEPEIFVRSAQIHALAPMMQFSAAPWRMLKGEAYEAVKKAAWTRMKFTPYILDVAKASAKTGEPMLRSLEYAHPGCGYETVNDQFLMGDKLLVAPQWRKGAKSRDVFVPAGTWKADDGATVVGPKKITVDTPLMRLPYFEKVS